MVGRSTALRGVSSPVGRFLRFFSSFCRGVGIVSGGEITPASEESYVGITRMPHVRQLLASTAADGVARRCPGNPKLYVTVRYGTVVVLKVTLADELGSCIDSVFEVRRITWPSPPQNEFDLWTARIGHLAMH